MKRRVQLTVLALAMTLCFAGCSKDTVATPAPSNTAEAPTHEPNGKPTEPVEVEQPAEPPSEPDSPSTDKLGSSQSKMQTDNHPEEWLWNDGAELWVTPEEFNALIGAQGSSFTLWNTDYSAVRGTPCIWWNGALTIQAYASSINSDYSAISGVTLWDPSDGRLLTIPETHSRTHDYYKIDSDGRMNTSYAVLLWQMMAACDTFVSMDEVLTEDTKSALSQLIAE